MTFSFTAMGALIVFCYLQVVASLICAAGDVVEHKYRLAAFHFLEALVIGFLLVVR